MNRLFLGRLFALTAFAAMSEDAVAGYNFGWLAPASVANGASYSVTVTASFSPRISGDYGFTLFLFRNSTEQVGECPGAIWEDASVNGWFADAGPQTVSFKGEALSYKGDYGVTFHNVVVNPPAPTGSIAGPASGVVGVASTYILSSQTNTTDWRWEVDLPGGGAFEWLGSYGTSSTLNWSFGNGAGTYQFRVHLRGPGGTAYTDVIAASAAIPPGIVSHPQGVVVSVGGSATFAVTASGTEPLSYQWRKDGAPIPNATAASYTITNVQSGDAGGYAVMVSNGAGSVTSNPATLTVNKLSQSTVAISPTSGSIAAGQSITFTASGGSGGGNYVWGGDASGTGTTKTVTFGAGATGSVNVYRAGDATYHNSNTAAASIVVFVSPPAAPAAQPAISVARTSFIAKWNAATATTGYRLDVSTDASFGSFVSGYQNLDVGNTTSATVAGLTPGTNYYYRVRAINPAGSSGNSNVIQVATTGNAEDWDDDGVPNAIEIQLGTDPNVPSGTDSSNQNNLNIHRPTP